MILAHLPAGYLAARATERMAGPVRGLLVASLVGAVAPDLDMLLFFAEGGRVHHHAYPTHWPVLWLSAGASCAGAWAVTRSRAALLGCAFFGNGVVHLLLDSVVGDVRWLAPLDDRAFALFTVSRRYEPWWVNFLLHGSFLLELALVVAAAVVLRQSRRAPVTST